MTDEQRAAALRRLADTIEGDSIGLSDSSETVADIRAGADAIEKLAKVEEALRRIGPLGISLRHWPEDSYSRTMESFDVRWGADGEFEADGATAIEALLAAHEAAKEGK